MSADSLSIIIVTLNEAHHLTRLKRSIDELTNPDGVEIETILIDGGSTDGTVEIARKLAFSQVLQCEGASIPVCRNKGAQCSRGRWIAYVDGDCELAPDWLIAARSLLTKHDRIILGWPAQPPKGGTWVQRAWQIHWANKLAKSETLEGTQMIRQEAFRLITTRNMILTRSAYDLVDGFDETLRTGEDTDFSFRAYYANVTLIASPLLRVTHYGEPATLSNFFKQQLWHANKASYATIMKNRKGLSGGNAPLFTILFLISLICAGGSLLAMMFRQPEWTTLGIVPLLVLVGMPAVWISCRAKKLHYAPLLMVLYAAYGLARALDLIGIGREKKSWKSDLT